MLRLCFLLALIVGGTEIARAADFCLFNKVYVGKDIAETTTIFRNGRVYDLLTQQAEITIFDPPGNRFVIIDPTRKIKTEVTTDQIDGFVLRVKAGASTADDPLARFLSEPTFEESFDPVENRLSLKSEWMIYDVKTQAPKYEAMAQQYAQYIQWQTKLNSVIRVGALPPFPRMKLNEALARQGKLPTEVQVTRFSAPPLRRPVSLRSEHRIQTAILPSDTVKLDEADKYLATFATVSMIEYQRRELPVAETAKAAK